MLSFEKTMAMLRLLPLMLLLLIPRRSLQFANKCNHIRLPSSIGRRCPSPSRCSHTLSWALPQFQIGDSVIVNDVDGTDQLGRVQDKRSGWYTIRLDRDATVVKRRGSQMEYNSDSDGMTATTSSNSKRKINRPSKEEMVSSPQPIILDLDSILQSIKQTTTDTDDIDDINSIIHNTSPNTTITHESIQQITNCHSHYTKWLLFSDLHVMPSTLTTCLQVLNTIHTTAVQRQAGILFLGDFWHHRGFVRVDCLNAVLEAMSKWSVPCIMIPGNHDQIDYRGVEHALTPLNNAYRITSSMSHNTQQYYAGPLILSHPTKFMDAFFIPHIRDKSMMKSILSSKEVAQSSALFVHADVKGASMNDLIQSRNGLSTSFFPSKKQIYSGHFHKPHIVTSSNNNKNERSSKIRYVGSPYQISSSEEGQSKSLLLVDSKKCWECIEEIPLDIGPRFHRVSSINEFFGISEEEDNYSSGVYKKLRSGDKVIVAISQSDIDALDNNEGGGNPFNERVKSCRKNGISVEIRDSQSISSTEASQLTNENDKNIEVDLEELSASATLAAYLENEVADGILDEGTAKELVEKGEAILRELNDVASNSSTPKNDASNTSMQMTDLDLESVSIRGFGLFREESTYPLRNRGVVLIRGRNEDFGSDSNGVGKSTIAMASLWALSGSLDPRPAQDGRVGDIVNDLSKVAEVTLRGTLNSKPFMVKRTKSKSSAGTLTFILDGDDLTRQSATDTQKLINEHFSSESQMLVRTIFHGQHSIGGLLEASDAKFKDELSQLVSLEIWQQSASLARSKQRDLLRRATEIDGMISLRENDKNVAHEKTLLAKKEIQSRQTILDEARVSFKEQELEITRNTLNTSTIEEEMNVLQSQMRQSDEELSDLDGQLSAIMESHNTELVRLRSLLGESTSIESDAKAKMLSSQRVFDRALIELQTAEKNLVQCRLEYEDFCAHQNDLSQDPTCHTCGQPIISVDARERVKRNCEENLSAALSAKDEADAALSRASLERDQAQAVVDAATLGVNKCLEDVSRAETLGSLNTNDVRERIHKVRSTQSERSKQFASLVEQSKKISNFHLEKAKLDANLSRLTEAFDSSRFAYERCCRDLEIVQQNIADLEKERDKRSRDAASTAMLVNVLGSKGIQAFVLQNIVDALQICSRPYLDELSEGSLQLNIQVGANDSIIKQAATRNPDGTWSSRPLASLSGGQWRRVSLSLSLGFAHLSSKRGNLRSSLLALDEPLTGLDATGRASVGKLLRKMCNEDTLALSTILVILQDIAAEEIEECFDQVDEVVKSGGESYIILDANLESVDE